MSGLQIKTEMTWDSENDDDFDLLNDEIMRGFKVTRTKTVF